MICPNCKKDYRDVPHDRLKGFVYKVDDNYYMKKKRFGMVCTNCGFIAEFITDSTGEPYLKRERNNDQRRKPDVFTKRRRKFMRSLRRR
jgi:hypothetical protein